MTERVLGIGGVFFRSERPDELAHWYEEHLGIERDPEFTGKAFRAREGDETVWALFPADTSYFGAQDKQSMVDLADQCLYFAKRHGRNQSVTVAQMQAGKRAG